LGTLLCRSGRPLDDDIAARVAALDREAKELEAGSDTDGSLPLPPSPAPAPAPAPRASDTAADVRAADAAFARKAKEERAQWLKDNGVAGLSIGRLKDDLVK
jgi:hypothetical protein